MRIGNIKIRKNIRLGNIKVGIQKQFPELIDLEVTPSAEEQIFKHEDSYGYDEVKVNAIQDENLIPDNIKKDVEILGVKGNLLGGKYKPRYTKNTITFESYKGTELDHETSMLDTTHFTNFNNMFSGCQNLTSLDLSGWNTSNVTSMFQVFGNCNNLTELNLSGWNTSNVTIMSNMFNWCQKLTHLDLSSFNTSNVTNMNSMFFICSKLKYLDIRNFIFDKVTNSVMMFQNVPKDCLIIVKGENEKAWVLNVRSDLTNVKTVAEYEGGE